MSGLRGWFGLCWSACLVAVACGDTQDPGKLAGLADGCTLNSECTSPLICAFQRCHTQCEETRDCPSGLRCVEGENGRNVCLLPDETGCLSTAACQGDQICGVDRQCRDVCTDSDECIGAQVCSTTGTCAEPDEVDGSGNLPNVSGSGGNGGGGASGRGGGAGEGGEISSGGTGASGGKGGSTGGTTSEGGEGGDPGTGGSGASSGSGGSGGNGGTAGSSAGNGGTAGSAGGGVGGMNIGGAVADDDGRGTTGSLVLEVTAAQTPAVPGGRVLYTITVGNTSTVDVDGVVVLFRVPEGLEFHYTQDADLDATSCGNGVCSPNEEASWTIGTIPAGSSQTITVNPLVLGTVGSGDDVAALVRLTATGVNTLDVTKSIPVDTLPAAEFTFTASTDPIAPGDLVELAFDIGQIGDMPRAGAELGVSLPGGLTPQSASDGGSLELDQVTWAIGDLSVGATLRRTVTVLVGDSVTPGDVLNPRAVFSYQGGLEPDHVAQVPLTVLEARQPLALTVSVSDVPAGPNRRSLYTATISNTSLREVEDVRLMMRVAPELTFHYTQDADPDSAACYDATCAAAEEAFWTLGSLPAGTTATVFINPNVVPAAAGDGTLVTNYFGLRAKDRNPINLAKTIPVKSAPAAQLALTTQAEPAVPGQSLTLELQVGQIGATPLAGSELTLSLPPELDIGAISDGGAAVGNTISWSLGTIPVAGLAARTVVVTVDDAVAAGRALQARAALTYDGGAELDASDELQLGVIAAPLPLNVTFETTIDPVVLGGRVLYTTTITNNSLRAVEGISLLLRVPPGVQFHYTTDADPDSVACYDATCAAAEEAVWAFASLAAGASQAVTVNALTATTVVGGSLITMSGRVKATDIGGQINLRKTIGTESP